VQKRPNDLVALAPVMFRLCPSRLPITTRGIVPSRVRFCRFEILPPTGHRRDTPNDEDDGEQTEDQDVEHDSLDHGQLRANTQITKTGRPRSRRTGAVLESVALPDTYY
jgi:hypothetical protein